MIRSLYRLSPLRTLSAEHRVAFVTNPVIAMSTTTTEPGLTQELPPGFTKFELVTAQGPVYRLVSSAPPRIAAPEEVPVIDVSRICGSLDDRKALAREVGAACRGYGFFYMKNHSIPTEKIDNARHQALEFFRQPTALKDKVSDRHSRFSNGWSSLRSRRVSPTESAG